MAVFTSCGYGHWWFQVTTLSAPCYSSASWRFPVGLEGRCWFFVRPTAVGENLGFLVMLRWTWSPALVIPHGSYVNIVTLCMVILQCAPLHTERERESESESEGGREGGSARWRVFNERDIVTISRCVYIYIYIIHICLYIWYVYMYIISKNIYIYMYICVKGPVCPQAHW